MTGIIALNELRRRLRDRSVLITAIVAPLAIAAILGFAFANRPPTGPLSIGVSGAPAAVVRAAAHAAQVSPNVTVRTVATPNRLERGGRRHLGRRGRGLPGAQEPGKSAHPDGLAWGNEHPGLQGGGPGPPWSARKQHRPWRPGWPAASTRRAWATKPPPLRITRRRGSHRGQWGQGGLDYSRAVIAVVFLFIGSGLGMRSLMLERTGGTLGASRRLTGPPERHCDGQTADRRDYRTDLHPCGVGGHHRRIRGRLG